MSRLVVVSNRVADLTKKTQTGGLAVGLADAVKERGGVWFGWDGQIKDAVSDTPDAEEVGKVKMVSVSMTGREYEEYYHGYSNSVLWPLLHYRLDLVDYNEDFLSGYERMNSRFASGVSRFLLDDDLIWVQDYHLIPLGLELRRLGCRQRIGFFLHTPFPPPDIFSASPNHKWLAESLLSYDVIGFQTRADLHNFLHYVEAHTPVTVDPEGGLHYEGREIVAGAFPIGIDVDTFTEMSTHSTEDILIDQMRRNLLERKQIIGVDRLDYSKGLPERMKAFERLLSVHPELSSKVSYLQVATPTREDVAAYADIKVQLEQLAGSINGERANFNWTPIRYIHRTLPRETLAALFRTSDVGFVTPLRDGMNLVAKEFVAAQKPEDPGVLVLSKFAGAAEELEEAIIVNPFDLDTVAASLHEALSMPLDERKDRHGRLLERVRAQDAKAWLASFLERLQSAEGEGLAISVDSLDDTSAASASDPQSA